MKKLVDLIGKIFSYNVVVFVLQCFIYALGCVFSFIYRTPWIFFACVCENIILCSIMYLIYEKKIKQVAKISKQIETLNKKLDSFNEGDEVDVNLFTDIKEINDLKDTLGRTIYRYNAKLKSTFFINDKALEFNIDQDFNVATKESFENQLTTILKETTFAKSLFCLVKLVGGKDRTVLKNLIAKTRVIFPNSILALHDDYTLSLLILNAPSEVEVKGALEYLVSNFVRVVVSKYEDRTDIYSCVVSACMYPSISAEEVINVCEEAFAKEEKISFVQGKVTIDEKLKEKDKKAFIINSLKATINEINEIKDTQKRFDLAKDILMKIANAYSFNHINIFFRNEKTEELYNVFDKYTNLPGRMFRLSTSFSKEDAENMISLFESDGISYFSNVLDLEPNIKVFYENFNIKSAYQSLIKKNGNIVCICSLESDKENIILDTEDRITINLFFHYVSLMISTYLSEVSQKRYETTLNALTVKLNKYLYTIEKDTYKLTYISENLKEKLPSLEINTCCYKALFNRSSPCKHCPLKDNIVELEIEGLGKKLRSQVLHYYAANNVETTISIEEATSTNNILEVAIDDVDPITNLKNIKGLHKDYEKILKKEKTGYIAILDIDAYLKHVELISQDEMNKVITSLADTLRANGYNENIYRFSDSTFVIILKDAKRPDALREIEKIFALASKPIPTSDYDLKLDYHCAIAMYPNDIKTISRLDKVVNICRDESIALGINCTYIYGEKGGRQAERKKYILDFIDEAIEKSKFEIYIQPIISTKDMKTPIYGEVLLRLKDPQRGFIPPNEFIPIANANGRMFGIEMSILNQVGELWRTYGFNIFHQIGVERISCNISSSSLQNKEFVEKVIKVVKKYKFPKNFLQFEINERLIKDNIDIIATHIKDLANYGISWSLDNYGSAGSDLNVLIECGFNQVKVDRSFIMDIDSNERNKISVSLIVNAALKGNMTVVAEGVETKEQLDIISSIGFTQAQGYYFYKPVSVNDYIKYLNFGK